MCSCSQDKLQFYRNFRRIGVLIPLFIVMGKLDKGQTDEQFWAQKSPKSEHPCPQQISSLLIPWKVRLGVSVALSNPFACKHTVLAFSNCHSNEWISITTARGDYQRIGGTWMLNEQGVLISGKLLHTK